MKTIGDLQKRAHEAAIRFLAVEMGMVSHLVAMAERSPDSKQRAQCLEEARGTVALVSRAAGALWLPDAQGDELWNRIRDLRDRVEQLSKAETKSGPRKGRMVKKQLEAAGGTQTGIRP